jgi:hypothetical protein
MNIKEVIQFLIQNGYILPKGMTYVMSAKFLNACKGSTLQQDMAAVPTMSLQQMKNAVMQSPSVVPTNWEDAFIKLITDAQVPARLESNRGEVYSVNKFSVDGCKAFRKAIEKDGYEYQLLVKSTMLYYKSGTRFKKAIGNYFSQGDFRSDYLTLKEMVLEGEDALQSHLKREVNDNQHTAYDLG